MEIAGKCPDASIEIGGHTDSDGSEAYNKRLSQSRASAVKSYLTNKGMSENRLTAVGYGELDPVANNGTKEGKAKNRRIEFKVKGVK
jgi:OOP family OmpA-OmpF porin